jgi:flagellar biosynthesis GTPase FlhF
MSDMITGDFNYASVDEDTAAKLEYFAKTGKALIRKSQIQFIADFGKLLSEARDVLASHDKNKGKFVKWATSEFDISKDTVYRYMNAWDRILSHGATTYMNWSPTALYMASADDFPKPAQKKLEKIPSTNLVRTCDVKRAIESSRPKSDPNDNPPFDDFPAMTPAEKKKADAAAERAKKKEEAEAAKKKKKEDAAAEKMKAKEAAAAAKMAARPKDEQVKLIKDMFQQHIDKAVRLLDDLHGVKPNHAARINAVRTLQGVKPW